MLKVIFRIFFLKFVYNRLVANTYCSCSSAPDRIAHNGSAPVLRIGIRLVLHNKRSLVWPNRDCTGIPANFASTSPLGLKKKLNFCTSVLLDRLNMTWSVKNKKNKFLFYVPNYFYANHKIFKIILRANCFIRKISVFIFHTLYWICQLNQLNQIIMHCTCSYFVYFWMNCTLFFMNFMF